MVSPEPAMVAHTIRNDCDWMIHKSVIVTKISGVEIKKQDGFNYLDEGDLEIFEIR